MEKIVKLLVFVVFVGFIVLDMVIKIPSIIHNLIYGIMAIGALFFIFTNQESMGLNKESLGLNNVFKKKSK